ncbi:MAG TPA: hypothetical protein VKC62_08215 [Gaiellaceae bacterium]|nr:hypothetical protein [Gaiellaceae bacterium]
MDWATVSALATGGGTLVLAGTTYASVRSANRAARVAELSLLAGLRPLIVSSSVDDRTQVVEFADDTSLTVPGGSAGVKVVDGGVYIALSLRNVGTGIGILHGGYVGEQKIGVDDHQPLEDFLMLTRDLYLPPGEVGFWQASFRNDPRRDDVRALAESGRFSVEILYGDFEGGQRMVTRVAALKEHERWNLRVARHWHLDRPSPR